MSAGASQAGERAVGAGVEARARAAGALRVGAWKVRAVVPVHNRRGDVEALLRDLVGIGAGLRAGGSRVELRVMVVDNASERSLADLEASPEGRAVELEVLRLEENRGGAGGFNAGLSRWLSRGLAGDRSELLWLLDSDARVEPGALTALIAALEADPELAAVGSVLCDPASGEAFEAGGWVDPRSGEYEQHVPTAGSGMIEVGYAAACSLLVRRGAVERAGVLADVFLNGDDVEWCYRLSRLTGGKVGVALASRVRHPRPDRMRTWARYYAARNFAQAAAEAGRRTARRAGFDVRAAVRARGRREVGRAVAMAAVGRYDLAWLHVRGLEDAARGGAVGVRPADLKVEPWRPMAELPAALRKVLALPVRDGGVRGRVMIRNGVLRDPAPVMRALNAACVHPVLGDSVELRGAAAAWLLVKRALLGPEYGVAVVSARGRAADWLLGRVMVTVDGAGFTVQRVRGWERAAALARVAWRGARAVRRLERAAISAPVPGAGREWPRPTLSVIVLSYNRWEKLEATLAALERDPGLAGAEVIVADNGSTDGTPEKLRERFPRVRVLAMAENRGVAAFNEGVRASGGEVVLILDDDAVPDAGAAEAALRVLAERADIGAVTLLPRHPATRASEWGFGEGLAGPDERWPVMGCANFVRREAWDAVGGYEESFFLYRNDTDLALKLLGAGRGVWFNPTLVAWHDSPASAAKSLRWFETATRNWVWVCRRHGRGASRTLGVLMGWLWAHRLAGGSAKAHGRVLKGMWQGLAKRPAPGPPSATHELARLLAARFQRKSSSSPRHSP